MRKAILRELPMAVLLVLPIIYLSSNWSLMPDTVPLHYNLYGEIDKWGHKTDLWFVVGIAPVLLYTILLLAKHIDPKQLISAMGSKFYIIRFVLSFTLASIAILFCYAILNDQSTFHSYIFIIIALLFIVMGNYFRNMKPNYFIGFRTPWTLESEEVWRLTHQQGSVIWFVGGILMLIINIWKPIGVTAMLNYVIIAMLILAPVLYSYMTYRSLNKLEEK